MYTLGVFIDLSKAFDTVDHDILISKLKNYGITGTNLKWFKNYLTDRKQCVTHDNKTTKTKIITYGVLQGSIILGPLLLFLLYINELHNASSLAKLILFAALRTKTFGRKNFRIFSCPKVFPSEICLCRKFFRPKVLVFLQFF